MDHPGAWSSRRTVVDEIRPVAHCLKNGVGLVDEVDLEAYVELDFIGVVPRYRNDGDEIEERHAAFAIVHEVGLAFLSG